MRDPGGQTADNLADAPGARSPAATTPGRRPDGGAGPPRAVELLRPVDWTGRRRRDGELSRPRAGAARLAALGPQRGGRVVEELAGDEQTGLPATSATGLARLTELPADERRAGDRGGVDRDVDWQLVQEGRQPAVGRLGALRAATELWADAGTGPRCASGTRSPATR